MKGRILFLGCLIFLASGAIAWGKESEDVSQLAEIQRLLKQVLKGQETLIEGQKKLSEEHDQIRQWVYNR